MGYLALIVVGLLLFFVLPMGAARFLDSRETKKRALEVHKNGKIKHNIDTNIGKIQYAVGLAEENGASKLFFRASHSAFDRLAEGKSFFQGSHISLETIDDGFPYLPYHRSFVVILDPNLGHNMIEIASDNTSFTYTFTLRPEPPKPNCNPGYVTVMK